MHILSCASNNIFGYIDMKTIYRGEPKDRNIEIDWVIYRPTEKVETVETR